MKTSIYFVLLLIVSLNLFYCKTLKKTLRHLGDDDEIATITSDNENELAQAIRLLNQNGGTIYIDTPVIHIVNATLTFLGTVSGGIIGERQANGEYPRLSFINSKKSVEFSGIVFYASNKFVEYIIIEHSLTFGIEVYGHNNIFDHVISRYNSGPGFVVSGDFNTFNYCYSYRNFNKEIRYNINGDGFRINGEIGNVFKYCFAWDNSNSGFNYMRYLNSSDLSYINSGSWNNGNINVFTGRYDFDSSYPLDKNLWTIQAIIDSDKNFVSNYYNGKFNIDNAKIDQYSIDQWISIVSPRIAGEGFTFGNQNSSQSIDVKRTSLYNVAFNNRGGGFVDNYDHKYNAFFTDCVSFNNNINYRIPYTLSRWSNNWSWNSMNAEEVNGNASLKRPANTNAAQRQFYAVRNQITNAVFANMFPDDVNFDRTIRQLS
jgi:hypothetical protein